MEGADGDLRRRRRFWQVTRDPRSRLQERIATEREGVERMGASNKASFLRQPAAEAASIVEEATGRC